MARVSVIISTYNGGKYLTEQLNSIYEQIEYIDEILIYDDCSTDNTFRICSEFKKNIGDKVILRKNAHNVGWKKNFFNLLYDASGDVIFYCDQDDVWCNHKVNRMLNVFDEYSDALCVSSGWDVIDGQNNYIYNFIEKDKNDKSIKKITFNDKGLFYIPRGCSLAIKKDLLKYINKTYVFNNDTGGTDRVICQTATLLGGMYKLYDVLFHYRVHSNNLTSCLEKMTKGSLGMDNISNRCSIVNKDYMYFESIDDRLLSGLEKKKVKHILDYSKMRINYLSTKKIKWFIKSILKSWSLVTLYNVFCDFIYVSKLNVLLGNIGGFFIYKLKG